MSTVCAPSSVFDPVRVYVLSDACHQGLILPDDPGRAMATRRYVEYGFGDFEWFAMGQESCTRIEATVLIQTQACLARRRVWATSEAALRRRYAPRPIFSLDVERADVIELRRELEARMRSREADQVTSPLTRMECVPDDHAYYWLFHNCTDALTDWLRQLGCEVSWQPIRFGVQAKPDR